MNGGQQPGIINFSRQVPNSQFSSKKSSIAGANHTNYVKNVGGSPTYISAADMSPKMRHIMKEGGTPMLNQTFQMKAQQESMHMETRNDGKDQSQSFYVTDPRTSNSAMLNPQSNAMNNTL